MSLFKRLFAASPDPREALRPLYDTVVAEARAPTWYRSGAADTVAGRFDMICAVLGVVLVRMERAPQLVAPSVLLTELFVHDMDGQLREFGVGDMVVGKHIGRLVSAMGGRLDAYRGGLGADSEALAEAVHRNVTLVDGADAAGVAEGLRALADRLDRTADADLREGWIAP